MTKIGKKKVPLNEVIIAQRWAISPNLVILKIQNH